MPAPDAKELVSRTKAILGYASESRAKLIEKAGIKDSDMKAWLDSSKTAHPAMEEVVRLAEAASVPRRFAERGFEDLHEAGGVVERIAALEDDVRQLAAAHARREVEERQRTAGARPRANRSLPGPRQ